MDKILTEKKCMAMFLRFLKEENAFRKNAFRNYVECFERSKRSNDLSFKDYFHWFFDRNRKIPTNLMPLGNIIGFSTTWLIGDELVNQVGYFYGLHHEWRVIWKNFIQRVTINASRV